LRDPKLREFKPSTLSKILVAPLLEVADLPKLCFFKRIMTKPNFKKISYDVI